MKLTTAKRKVTIQTLSGIILILISLVLVILTIFIFLIKSDGLLQEITHELFNIILMVFGSNMPLVLNNAPQFHYPDIFVKENMDVASVLAIIVLGITMINSSKHLSNRIREFKSKSAKKSGMNPYSSEFTSESKDSWYTRPIGLISLLVASNYIIKIIVIINQMI